jgi:dTDP-4-amino-4,6-dideoxygalactose transaminase
MRDFILDFSPPDMGEEEIQEVRDTLRSDWVNPGEKTKQFEEDFASFIGAEEALAVNSGTEALLLGLATLGLKPGEAVITTPMTFCSTVNVIEHLKARPILVDVEPQTLNIDPKEIEKAIFLHKGQGKGIKGILPVHLYGHPCEMDAILELARLNNSFVLEDAAHALPAKFKGRMVGTIGDLAAFSFYATKNISTADGGMLTGAKERIEKARSWTLDEMRPDTFGEESADDLSFLEVIPPGFRGTMSDIQASLGIQQLKKLPQFQNRRREIVARYQTALADLPELELPREKPEVESSWHLYVIRLNLERLTIDRDRFIEEMKKRRISTSVHFIPVHLHPYYRDKYSFQPTDFPVAYENFQRIVSLPLFTRMSNQDVDDVIEVVYDVINRFKK